MSKAGHQNSISWQHHPSNAQYAAFVSGMERYTEIRDLLRKVGTDPFRFTEPQLGSALDTLGFLLQQGRTISVYDDARKIVATTGFEPTRDGQNLKLVNFAVDSNYWNDHRLATIAVQCATSAYKEWQQAQTYPDFLPKSVMFDQWSNNPAYNFYLQDFFGEIRASPGEDELPQIPFSEAKRLAGSTHGSPPNSTPRGVRARGLDDTSRGF